MENKKETPFIRFIKRKETIWAAVIFVLVITGVGIFNNTKSYGGVDTNSAAYKQAEQRVYERQLKNAASQTDQQRLESTLSAIVSGFHGTTDVSYKNIKIEPETDSDRPKDSKMLTIGINVADFYDKSAFIKDTGKLSAQLFQVSFPSYIKPYDVFIWFYGETVDRYGNKKTDVIQVYAADRVTYSKINWQNFNSATLCDFLKQEEQIGGLGSGPACHTTVNIQ